MALYLRLLKFLRPYWVKLVFAVIFMSFVGSTDGFTAYFVKPVMDQIFFEKNGSMLLLIPFAIILFYLAKGGADYMQAYLMGFVGQKVITDIRNLVFRRLQVQPLSYFDKTPTGTIISRITNDISLVQGAVSDSFTAILKDMFTIVGLLFVIFYRDWRLALVAFIVLPIVTYPIVSFGRKLRKNSTQNQRAIAKFTSFLHETITGQRIVKAFAMEGYEYGKFRDENESLFRIVLKRYKIRALSSPITDVIGGIAVAVIIWYGGSAVISGKSTPGNLFSFIAALLLLYEPIKRLNRENHNVQQGLAAAQRVFEIVDRQPEIADKPDAANLAAVEGTLEFRGVSFKYEDRMVLNDINLRINRNETVAIVGESGVGKTTLVNLILRFYDVSLGSISIDGIDIRDATLNSLRRNIALVTQDVILFNDTIANNIVHGIAEDRAKMAHATDSAYASDFISRMPKKLETIVGEKGVRLSGGQKQRIAIARALYKDAPILILDEATSALDAASETEVQKALDNLMKGRTTIVIAHRLSTIINADRIIVLEAGTIVQEGTHRELIEAEGPYKRLYQLQFKDEAQKKVIRMTKRPRHA
ncbi:MAG TPA: lipid A export permease/ATP-binding protein MsbA [Syntrophorhabdales bacterium]|nr:lipid A export permease/ATP-binding protein MsbA [Syntrophorhabdales bacterium]